MILLTTANARYSHSSLGLRYLYANMQELQYRTQILEHTIKDNAESIVNDWLIINPQIIGIGVYIWNLELLVDAIELLKNKHPHIIVVIGGPEVSFGTTEQLFNLVDYIIPQEGDHSFRELCNQILNDKAPTNKLIAYQSVAVSTLALPYKYYTKEDIQNRKIYVEASRGCVFQCQFCLSSLDQGIRVFDTKLFLSEIKFLYQRGARQFKFVDRTFNLQIKQSVEILDFFLTEFPKQDYFLHFEFIPDRLPQELKESILNFKSGVLQFEVGIQTFNTEVSRLIGRRQNKAKALKNLHFLRHNTSVHLHVDLIIGLPGATMPVFKEDLNELVSLGLQEIQIGILKKLKGTPIDKHTQTHDMVYDTNPPYEIESNIDLSQEMLLTLKNFAKYWDHYYNSGNFIQSMRMLFALSNPFDAFFAFSLYAFSHLKKNWGISLDQYAEVLYDYLSLQQQDRSRIRHIILSDILNKPGRKVPSFLKDYKLGIPGQKNKKANKSLVRQQHHFNNN